MHALFWFRRDLRIEDNRGLYSALAENKSVMPIFIFDKEILSKLTDKSDKRVTFIHHQLTILKRELEKLGTTLSVYYGTPITVFQEIEKEWDFDSVYTNHDYEPYARKRDLEVKRWLSSKSISFKTFKDQVIFEKDDILKDDGTPYSVYSPYSRKWKLKYQSVREEIFLSQNNTEQYRKMSPKPMLTLKEIGFSESKLDELPSQLNTNVVKKYHETRDIPSIKGTSRLSVHLRFGTISIRKLAREASQLNEKYLNELIWREFYMMILWHFPEVNRSFKPKYEHIPWSNNEEHFKKWCEGKTGIPIVDAGMRELNETGFMHNRVRMIVASFLTKNLLIDWRWGEAYFAEKLLDFELSSNNGGWQWAASSGCDAAPYFRIFNPESQAKKFDPELKYIRKWVPEFDDPFVYPKPIVDLKQTRAKAIEVYKNVLNSAN